MYRMHTGWPDVILTYGNNIRNEILIKISPLEYWKISPWLEYIPISSQKKKFWLAGCSDCINAENVIGLGKVLGVGSKSLAIRLD